MRIDLPELCLVALVGPSGSGKSTFARRHFKPTEVISSDACRGIVSDDENSQEATKDAFDLLHYIAAKRLARGLLTVVDATNVEPESRRPLVKLAREHHVLPVAIVLNVPERLCHDRNAGRPDRQFGPHVIRRQRMALKRDLRNLAREGFRKVFILNTPEEIDAATVVREPLWNNRTFDHGPFDIIGDIHGCYDELVELLERLGYQRVPAEPPAGASDPAPHPSLLPPFTFRHPQSRRPIFLGDLVDRGPNTPAVLHLVMHMRAAGAALCVPGNHDVKLLRKLCGKDVRITHGLAETLAQLAPEPPEFIEAVKAFLDDLVSHYVLDDGRLVVAHAGMKERFQGRASREVREFALYGETTGESDAFGLPIRYNWAADYRGRAMVVYGHTPVPDPEWLNNTINIDTGCVFGGRLTALRYPERELISVPARATYAQPAKPFLAEDAQAPALTAQQQLDDVLDIADVLGKRIISTRLHHNVTIREENAAAALEVMSRFATDPRWLIYLPPTMSPCETSREPGLLEHPSAAFAHYRERGVPRVVCQEKHMGSRAVVIVCRDTAAAVRRFGVTTGETGVVYTRTGRRFFEERDVETALLDHVRAAATAANLWDDLHTDWLLLDCELMPWSAKAQALLREQYAAAGAAATAALRETLAALAPATAISAGADALLARYTDRAEMAAKFVQAYGRYCWPVGGLSDLRLAPFHLLATERGVHIDQTHLWHMDIARRLAEHGGPVLMATTHIVVDLADAQSESAATQWWTDLTARGGEGMVVKPLDFIARGTQGLLQPAVKVRGAEYLRIIYGPEYTHPDNLDRLRQRGLAAKRSLALREFALGIEALERFARREPLRRVHECVFGVLALESEPVDPRL